MHGQRVLRGWVRPMTVGLIALELAWIGFVFVASIGNPAFGLDYAWHVAAAERLIDTGTPYWPWQLSGPYEIANGAILYPPPAFLLFIPFIWLPAVLWWAIPIAVTGFAMTRHRPPYWVWPIALAPFALEKSLNVYVFGNPSMWIVAAVAAGTVWSWPFVFVLLKPTFAPIALLGVRHRSWWVVLAALAVVSVAMYPLWVDWFRVATNSNVSLAYNLPTVPLLCAPLIPWLAVQLHRRSTARPAIEARARMLPTAE